MAELDLKSALEMFTKGVNDLAFSRALSSANDQVQQVKASEMNEHQQRAALQGISDNLTSHMAQYGVPATTMYQVAEAVGPKHYKNANEMFMNAQLLGKPELENEAHNVQNFENNKAFELAKIKANASAAISGYKEADKTDKQFADYAKIMNAGLANSRTQFGNWAAVEGRGARIDALLGDPAKWNKMTAEQLELVKGSMVQMSEGKAMTESDHKALSPWMAKIELAKKQTAITGKPVELDLSGFANLYSGLVQKESEVAANGRYQIGAQIATGNMRLYKKDPGQFKATTATAFSDHLGKIINPDDIQVSDGRVTIKPGVLAKAPKLPTVAEMSTTKPSAATDGIRTMMTKDGKMVKVRPSATDPTKMEIVE